MNCKECKTNIPDTAKFCPKCGTKAEDQIAVQDIAIKKCPKCGADNPLYAKFCKVDGYNFQNEEKTISTPVEPEKPSNKIICSKCGTAYDIGVKFCRKDGASLKPDSPTAGVPIPPDRRDEIKQSSDISQRSISPKTETVKPTPIPKKTELPKAVKTGGKNKNIIIAVAVLALFLLAAAGGYLYFGSSPDKIASKINDELKEKGLSLYCEVDKDWTATLKGNAKNASDKVMAMGIVNSHKEIKELKYEAQMPPAPYEVKLAIDNALRDGGIRNIHSEVDDNLTATLKGIASDEFEKENAIKIASGLGKAKVIRDSIQTQSNISRPSAPEPPAAPPQYARPREDMPRSDEGWQHNPEPSPQPAADPVRLEGEINRSLRNAGLSGITAEVGDDMSVTLKGSTVNRDYKSRALELARSFSGIRRVRDRIFVVRSESKHGY